MKYEKGTFITVPRASIIGIGVGPQSLYMWLCSYANNSDDCFPSRATLAEMMGCTERTVDGYLEELISLGLVEKESRYIEGRQTSNLYFLPLRVAENNTGGVAKSARGEVAESAHELNPVLTKTNELKYYIEEENPKKEKTSLEGFESWWSIYPRKSNKVGASAVWRKLTTEERAEALKGAERVVKSKIEPEFVPMPNKWLENRRWEDELPVKKPNILVL